MTTPTHLSPFVDLMALPVDLADPIEDLISKLLDLQHRCEQLRPGVDLVDLLAAALNAVAIELLSTPEGELR